jgi:CrcB protein
MNGLLAVAAGGAIGATCRYLLVLRIQLWTGVGFPYGTLAVNLLGSAAIGCLYVLAVEREMLSETARLALVVGVLGSFTTFSSFSLEALTLIEQQRISAALVYVFSSVGLCLLGTWLGLTLTKMATHA